MDAPLPATGRTQPVSLSRRQLLAAAAGLLPGGRPAGLASAARGRMVAWHAWAGCERTNAFIAWVAEQMMVRHGVRVRHVRLADPAAACARLAAGPDGGGADLVSVEDADLAGLRARGLLMPGLLARLPHAALLDADLSHLDPSVGDAAPWRRWRSVLVFNAARLPPPPARLRALPGWAAARPGRLAHAAPHDPLGARFLAEALRTCAPDPAALARAPTAATLAPAIRATRAWYAALRPALWRQGRAFPRDLAEQRAMMRAGEIDLALAANPSEAVAGAANGLLPAGARAVALAGGAIGGLGVNVVPAGAARPEAALLLADFLLSPSAQAHAMDGRILGSPTVLAPRFLSAFSGPHAPAGPASLGEGVAVAGPHPGWTAHLAMICGSCSSTIAARGIVTQP